MSTHCKQYTVTIFGKEYTLKSDDPVETVSIVAQLVDTHMHEIAIKTGSKDTSLIAILTAIKLAHALHASQKDANSQLCTQNILISKIDQTLQMLDSF